MTEETTAKPETPPEAREEKNYLLDICFDGTNYHGWQIQPNGITVQQAIQDRLTKLFAGKPIRLFGASRTDAGVHSLGFTASFKAPPSPYIPDWKIKKALNRLLPPDIKINDISIVPDDFNPRFAALAKIYTYVIHTGSPTPFSGRWCWHLPDFTRLDSLREALNHIEGTHDFSAFTVEAARKDDCVRTIFRTDVDVFGNFICVSFLGDGFLYKMIRSLMGTLAPIARGRLHPDTMKSVLESKDRCMAGDTCPPNGLFLVKVFFKENEWADFKISAPPFYF